MLKKFLLLLSLILCQALVLSSFAFKADVAYARGLEDGIFDITNPETNASVIVNKDGKILLKSIDPNNESIYIVYDLFTDKPAFLAKVFSGEEKVTKTVTYSNDEEWSYSDPSERTVLYYLDGTRIGFEASTNYGRVDAVGDKIFITAGDDSLILDSKTKEVVNKVPYRALIRCGNVALSYSYDSDQEGVKPPKFVFHVNSKNLVHFSYYRYLENKIRESFDLVGTPIILKFKNRGDEE